MSVPWRLVRSWMVVLCIALAWAVAAAAQTTEGVPALLKAPEHEDPRIRARAAATLAGFGPAAAVAVSALVARLGDGVPEVRQAAARALGEIGSAARAALPALSNAATDTDPGVRAEAAIALGKIRRR